MAIVWAAGLQINFAEETDLLKLAAANNNFAFKLLAQLATAQPAANIFVSPYSCLLYTSTSRL